MHIVPFHVLFIYFSLCWERWHLFSCERWNLPAVYSIPQIFIVESLPLSSYFLLLHSHLFSVSVTQSQTQVGRNRRNYLSAIYLATAPTFYPIVHHGFCSPNVIFLLILSIWQCLSGKEYDGNTMTAVFWPSWDSLTDSRLICSLCWDRDLQSFHTRTLNWAWACKKKRSLGNKCVCHAQLNLPFLLVY